MKEVIIEKPEEITLPVLENCPYEVIDLNGEAIELRLDQDSYIMDHETALIIARSLLRATNIKVIWV